MTFALRSSRQTPLVTVHCDFLKLSRNLPRQILLVISSCVAHPVIHNKNSVEHKCFTTLT